MFKEVVQYLQSLGAISNERPAGVGYPSEIVSVPAGRTLVDLEKFQGRQNRIKHRATMLSADSFAAYVNRFKGDDTSIYVDIFGKVPSLTAVIDHHGNGKPAWGGHVAIFAPKFSLEWQAWKALHAGGAFNQASLVAFMEDHANDLDTPSPAKMLTAAKTFEAVEKHSYKSAMNLDNGNMEIVYVKDGSQAKVQFPHTLTIRIPILENEEPVKLEGRLRYRTGEGSIAFTFQFKTDPERVQRDALRAVAELVSKQVGKGVAIYEGAASS